MMVSDAKALWDFAQKTIDRHRARFEKLTRGEGSADLTPNNSEKRLRDHASQVAKREKEHPSGPVKTWALMTETEREAVRASLAANPHW